MRDFECRLTVDGERIERRITGTSTSDVVGALMAEYGDRVTYMSVRKA